MGQKPRILTPEVSAAHRFGAELRRWRTARGLSLARLAPLVLSTASTLNAMEWASRPGVLEVVRHCDEVLEADGELIRLYARIADEHKLSSAEMHRWEQQSLCLSPGLAEAAALLIEMGSMDIARRSLLKSIPYAATALAGVKREWLLELAQRGGDPDRLSSDQSIAAARTMIGMLDELDNTYGGGYARSTAVHYLTQELLPQLKAAMPEQKRNQLVTLAAKLCAMTGWMSYDQAGFGLGQRYMTQGLRLCLDGGDNVLAGQIFAGMSHLATAMGDPAEGLSLAQVGLATAKRSGSPLGVMRIHAMAARAFAALGDGAHCAQQLCLAERALDASHGPDNEKEWVRFLDDAYLAGESAQSLNTLGDHATARELAAHAVKGTEGKGRRHSINLIALATSRLNSNKADLDGALDAGHDALRQMIGLSSERGANAVRQFRHQLRPYVREATVKAFHAEAKSVLAEV